MTNIEQDPAMFLKPDVLDNKDNIPIDNSHQEGVMIMKMARKIEGLAGNFGCIRLVADDQNVRFTNNFFNKGQRDGDLMLNTAIAEHKIENKGKVYGNQRTVWWGFKLELLAPKLNVSEKKKEKAKNSHKFASAW